ncbi:hypothetical protein QAD02_017532 [Eretmocerus hayati]|uniref:Uncharacterized protein n=1 Tax=Eretmocerus hayati TaxID=131215 RepID=A0ACC2PE64_9HYME|nr:hypothetical protein QAD02_017532 [Eretmocerus hayati]
MVTVQTVATVHIKTVKLIINLIILILYRWGYGGEFLGVGGTWNSTENKSADTEIMASGIFVGFFIYTSITLVSFCFGTMEHKKTGVEIIMNFIGFFMFIVIGGIALHFWIGYLPEHKLYTFITEREAGIAMGLLCVVEGVMYIVDFVLSLLHFSKEYMY